MKREFWAGVMALLIATGCNQVQSEAKSSQGEDGNTVPASLRGAGEMDDDGDDGEESEESVSLANVPAAAKAAALAAVPGLVLEEAEKEGADRYCLHGTAGGTFYEVEVTASGDVSEIETGEDDEEDD
jgi:hypothetical protein